MKTVRPVGGYILVLLVGVTLGAIAFSRRRGRGPRILTRPEYEAELKRQLDSSQFSVVKVFGYTGELIANQLVSYLARYRSGVELRLLHRSWLAEKEDEQLHNSHVGDKSIRPWDKSSAIRRLGVASWPQSMKRGIRYYGHQPTLRAVILSTRGRDRSLVFFNFLRWEPLPEEGGSQFKAGPGYMLLFDSRDGEGSRDLIKRIDSQFEYEWNHGLTVDQLLESEQTISAETLDRAQED